MWSMHYYKMWVSSPRYHGDSALTYSSETPLKIGSIAIVPLQNQTIVSLVVEEVPKPSFRTKSILRVVSTSLLPEQLTELIEWLKDYYPSPFGQLMSLFLPNTLTTQSREKLIDTPADPQTTQHLPRLTKEQTQAIATIHKEGAHSVLLHGNTGSGKTRVYLELIKETIAQGKSAILLTPEIGLTPQLAIACSSIFPDQTIVVHSDISPAKRKNIWLRILESTKPLVVIGARSALFSPLHDIGLIVIDEFHETSYKQEQAPHYQAPRVAAKLAILHQARLILGSATPPIADYYVFQQKKLPIVRMKVRAVKNTSAAPHITVIDLKNRDLFRQSQWLSEPLLQDIKAAIEREEQSLIFLNRRGTARLVLCQNCAWQALCPRCDLSLTYHGDTHNMQCHTCGYSERTPVSCPTCSASDIIFRTIGTKALVTELLRLFPSTVIKRFDSDALKSEKLEQQYEAVRDGSVDILVGTQMLGKGLDLPKLSVLGIVQADTSLSFPDYTAEERTFQLLTQVIGRVNRGHIPGRVCIQTYHPDSPLLDAAIAQDYAKFFGLQLAERQRYAFPPFRFALKLTCSRTKRATAEQATRKLADELRSSSRPIEIIGPSPSFLERVQNRYRWQIVIKSVSRGELIRIIKELPANWSYDIDPINLL